MNMPGFSAEASFHRMVLAYNVLWGLDQLGNVVWPQQVTCDQTCLDNCISGCPDPGDCSDLLPAARARCLAQARACYAACQRKCCQPCAVTCGPCTGGSCGSYPTCMRSPGTQTCTDCNQNTSTRSC
jgi:hypothetical protein